MKSDWQKHNKQLKEGRTNVISPTYSHPFNQRVVGNHIATEHLVHHVQQPGITKEELNRALNNIYDNVIVPLQNEVKQLKAELHVVRDVGTQTMMQVYGNITPEEQEAFNVQSGPSTVETAESHDAVPETVSTEQTYDAQNKPEMPGETSQNEGTAKPVDLQGLEGLRHELGSIKE